MKIYPMISILFALVIVVIPAHAAESSPKTDGVLTSAAEQLAALVESFVTSDEIVGGEVLVIHDRRPILHRAFGFKDREAKQPMERDQFFAVRSMTKPFTGMAAQILIDEGKLEMDAQVARYLPSFDHDASRAITVRQILTHQGGFPFVDDPGRPLSTFSGLRELANRAGTRGPAHPPGLRFVYSDVGSDVLGAVVSEIAGQPLEEFIRERILIPLRLDDTFPEREAVTPARRDRVPTRYLGVAGHWSPYWSAASAPIYPFLKGSGGLFSTAQDYARFLQAWMDRERGEARQVLSPVAFDRALTPVSRNAMSTGFPEAVIDYGQMWMIYRPRHAPDAVFGFGHGGSDGTHAYAFPEHKLIVCYMTQTRGGATSARFEAALSHLFLRPDAAAMARLLQPAELRPLAEFTGIYAKGNHGGNIAGIVELGGMLAFEFPGRTLLRLRPTEERDRWVPERAPNDAVIFRRSDGRVVGLEVHRDGRIDTAERFRPDPALPTVDELMTLRARAVSPELLAGLLPLRIHSELHTPGGKRTITALYDADGRSFTELDLGAGGKVRTWTVGDRAWRQRTASENKAVEVHGIERAEQLSGTMLVELGDWRQHYREIMVLARETFDGEDVFRVRLQPRDGIASTKLVSAKAGVVVRDQGLTVTGGGGYQPVDTRHRDFRAIDGVMLAFERTLTMAAAPSGPIRVNVTNVETRAIIDRGAFIPRQ